MEQAEYRIGSSQFFLTMFVTRAVLTMGLNTRHLGGENLLDAIGSCVLALGLGLVLSLPVLAFHRRHPGETVPEAARMAFGAGGKLISLLYAVYFLLTAGASLGLFLLFLLAAVNPEFSAFLAAAGVLAVALYGAYRGLETVARCGVCVFALLLAGSALMFGIVAARFDPENLESLFVRGYSQTLRGAAMFLSRTSVFAHMAVLLPRVTGRKAAGLLGWAGGVAAFVGVMLLLLAGCLGPYAATQEFPLFSLATLTEIRSMQRLDAVFVGLWLMGLTVKLACDVYACRVCFAALRARRRPKAAVAVSGTVILLTACSMALFPQAQRWLLDYPLPLTGALLTGGVFPLLALAGGRKGGGAHG